MINKIQNLNLIPEQNDKEKDLIIHKMIESIVICHEYIRELFDRSSVSLREIRRFEILFKYFIKFFENIE